MAQKEQIVTLAELWADAKPKIQTVVPFDLDKHTAVVFRIGSHAHGTHVPPEDPDGIDDTDLMVIVVPPPQFVLGMRKFEHAEYKVGNLDVVVYEWSKWLRLIAKSNPNVVGTLWNGVEDVLLPGFIGYPSVRNIFDGRASFLSRRMYPAFIGYAHSQLHKMTHFAHQGYMGEKRKTLMSRFGYDVKNAAHLIRLLRMACEVLENGTHLNVRRPDAKELIDIKRGRWLIEDVKVEADILFARAKIALEKTSLPMDPDEELLEDIMMNGYFDFWGFNG